MTGLYDSVRANVDQSGEDSRVEVNQRALIDKILARYASAGAVYRELLQNSNDAEATEAEIQFTMSEGIVEQVVYRNNGIPFRSQDWSRLKKIAEGNPDVSKVGAFGVGAYTMFSICEEPLVISGDEALAFIWRGDALWTKTAPNKQPASKWTSFVLPSRDPYPLPDLAEFGEFLCASLTFTKCLVKIRVLVDDNERLLITKTLLQEPTVVKPPKSSGWWKKDGANTASSNGTFYLSNPSQAINETVYEVKVQLDGEIATVKARYVSATAKTRIPSGMATRMERVTKKRPPSEVLVQIFINAQENTNAPKSKASQIVRSFSPQVGVGRIFIGFRTSQTTGLAAHLAAPFVPTVEREAIDMQDPTLKIFNSELLQFSGILMRLTLEHSMSLVEVEWKANQAERDRLDEQLQMEGSKGKEPDTSNQADNAIGDSKTDDDNSDDDADTVSGGSILSFAKYMAQGLKKKIVSVVKDVIDDGSELLNPKDPRPLSSEERHAILLMQSFCPRQSTPDANVGACVAQGFSICMPSVVPPVLTRSGVVRGDEARLPNQGIESFVKNNVIRKVVYQNAEEYHTVIARCKQLNIDDLTKAITAEIIPEDKMILFIKWWTKLYQVDPYITPERGLFLKENIRFYAKCIPIDGSKEGPVVYLKDLLFYIDSDSLLAKEDVPLPESVLPKVLQDQLGIRILSDNSISRWFSPLPMEIWVEFISHHTCMTAGQPEDEKLRLQLLLILSKEFSHRQFREKAVFGSFCQSVLADKRCLPFDSSEPSGYAAERPSELYLYSAELRAFDGIGSFHKVAQSLQSAGVTEEFLLALGVRKSVAVHFLFANLDTLRWSDDPKPLIEYLRTATLSKSDWEMLRTTQYLPAENDTSRTFAPQELFLPDPDLRVFPFLRLLQWPSDEAVSARSPNGSFLVKVGMRSLPSLTSLLRYISEHVKDNTMRLRCLDYICKRMGPNGLYQREYSYLRNAQRNEFKILPCVTRSFLNPGNEVSELRSPVNCFCDPECGIMGFPIIDPKLGETGKLYGSLFQCSSAPEAYVLLNQLVQLVTHAKNILSNASTQHVKEESQRVLKAFSSTFRYLSSRTSEFSQSSLNALRQKNFIPCDINGSVEWFRPDQVFFKGTEGERDVITEKLFHALVEFSPFLAAVGVRDEATTKDLFQLMIASPEKVLETLGSEETYRMLLRRIAANPPFSRVTTEIQRSPFLLAYTISQSKNGEPSEEKRNFKLAKAEDVYIIDNSFFGRMFSVNRAPHESDLEEFYFKLGSPYISKKVEKRFEVAGAPVDNTPLLRALRERIDERGPLLVSPSVTSRPLVSNAASVLDKEKLILYKASNLLAVYSLGSVVRRQRVTCCLRPLSGKKNALYITQDFDWFDVGYAIGDLILQRCQLEDAFFISSLLEAPLEQLRARGFPVDRILKPEPIKMPPPKPRPKPTPAPDATKSTPATKTSNAQPQSGGSAPGPTIAAAPPPSMAEAENNGSKVTEDNAANVSKDNTAVTAEDDNAKAGKDNNENNERPQAPANDQGSSSVNKHGDSGKAPDNPLEDGEEVSRALKQMFPDADEEFIQERLGSNPSMADVQSLVEDMASGNYPKKNSQLLKKNKGGSIRKKLGRALGFGSGSSSVGPGPEVESPSPLPPSSAPAVRPAGTTVSQSQPSSNDIQSSSPKTPQEDSQSHSHLENMLRNTVGKSTSVNSKGISAPDTLLTSIPEGLDRGNTCEVIPGHSLKPFEGLRGDGQTHNNIRVFSSGHSPESEKFLCDNLAVVEMFSLVIARLCSVFDNLKLDSVAIFHDPCGGTIAFNANRALHFNVRYFYSLHFLSNKYESAECYSYWFVTMAHELAHHLASGHNKEHGFYTESYVSLYLPKLVSLLSTL